MHTRQILVTLFLLLAITGCSQATATNTLIEYQRAGGLLNFNDRLTIQSDGSGVVVRSGQRNGITLTPAEIQSLTTKMNSADFTNLQPAYNAPPPHADLITYILTYKGYTVQLMDGMIPVPLQPALDELNRVVERKP